MAKRRFKTRKAQKRVKHRKGQSYIRSSVKERASDEGFMDAIRVIANRMGKRGD